MSRNGQYVHESESGRGVKSRARIPAAAVRDLASRAFAMRAVDLGAADEAGVEEVELDGVGQPARQRLVAHRVDRELERIPRPLPRHGRVADVARLVVGDRDLLPAEQAASAPRRPAPSPRRVRRPSRRRPVTGRLGSSPPARCRPGRAALIRSPSSAEAELALDLGRDDGARLQLLLAEPPQRLAARLETRLLVLARQEALVLHATSNASISSSSVMTSPRAWRRWNSWHGLVERGRRRSSSGAARREPAGRARSGTCAGRSGSRRSRRS